MILSAGTLSERFLEGKNLSDVIQATRTGGLRLAAVMELAFISCADLDSGPSQMVRNAGDFSYLGQVALRIFDGCSKEINVGFASTMSGAKLHRRAGNLSPRCP